MKARTGCMLRAAHRNLVYSVTPLRALALVDPAVAALLDALASHPVALRHHPQHFALGAERQCVHDLDATPSVATRADGAKAFAALSVGHSEATAVEHHQRSALARALSCSSFPDCSAHRVRRDRVVLQQIVGTLPLRCAHKHPADAAVRPRRRGPHHLNEPPSPPNVPKPRPTITVLSPL